MTPQPPAPRPPSSLPIVAVVLSVLGFCFPPLLLAGIVCGVIALVQGKGSQVPAIVAVALPVAAVPIIGILAAIAIPNFIKFGVRAKQAECKSNLKAAYTAQKAFFAEKDAYDVHPATLGFTPLTGNRYLYVFSADGQISPNLGAPGPDDEGVGADPRYPGEGLRAAIPADLRATLGVHGKCPDCTVTMACAGNLDTDATIDVWSISTGERPGIKAGEPHLHVDDVRD